MKSKTPGIKSLIISPLFYIILLIATLFPFYAYSIPKEIEYALKLNRINHYDEALRVINEALKEDKIKPDITSAYTIGRILYRKAELYREMADISKKTNLGYLLQLNEANNGSSIVKLFLGISYFFNEQYIEAAGVLNQVIRSSGNSKDEIYDLAYVYLGGAYFLTGEKGKAKDLWKKVEQKSLLAKSVLGYLYAFIKINPSYGESLAKEALEKAELGGKANVDIYKMNYAYTMLAQGKFSEAYNVVLNLNLDLPIYVYRPNSKKEVRFYDLSILDSYSKILFGESIKNLEPIVSASSGELASFAAYYVGQMYLYLGNLTKAMKYAQKAQRLAVTGSLTMFRAIALEASVLILEGKKRKGVKSLKEEIQLIYGKPSFLLEMSKVLIVSGIKYSDVKVIIGMVENYIYSIKWTRRRRETALMGDISLYAGRYVKAIYYYERARDKGNKNKIETNDPTFLIKLAYVYYVREYYPESLEILFSLGKYFRGTRIIQNAVQSVYSYRQKGTGEALMD